MHCNEAAVCSSYNQTVITGGGGGKRGVCTVTRLLYAAPNHRAVDSDHRRRRREEGVCTVTRLLYAAHNHRAVDSDHRRRRREEGGLHCNEAAVCGS